MTKDELITTAAQAAQLDKRTLEKALAAILQQITESLGKGDDITLRGFGTFKVTERKARTARNPRTGEAIQVSASKALNFKAGKELKDRLNASS